MYPFAGLKAVGESVEKPLEYYDNNVAATLVLLDVMREHGCKNIISAKAKAELGWEAQYCIDEMV